MAFNTNAETAKIAIGNVSLYCGATQVGMISGEYDFDDGAKVLGPDAAQTGKAKLRYYLETGNCVLKCKLITLDPEKAKMTFSQLTYATGGIMGSTRAAESLKDNIWTLVVEAVDVNGTIYNEVLMHPKSIQIFKGIQTKGYQFKMSESKPFEIDIEITGTPDLTKPKYAQYAQNSSIVLPAPSGMFVNMTAPGVGYSTLPTSITCAALTGSTFTSQIVNGALNIIISNPGTAVLSLLGTFQPLVITGGTSTTAATAQIYIG